VIEDDSDIKNTSLIIENTGPVLENTHCWYWVLSLNYIKLIYNYCII